MKTPSLSRQHFEFIAEQIRVAYAEAKTEGERTGVRLVGAAFATSLGTTNPRFDADKFRRYVNTGSYREVK